MVRCAASTPDSTAPERELLRRVQSDLNAFVQQLLQRTGPAGLRGQRSEVSGLYAPCPPRCALPGSPVFHAVWNTSRVRCCKQVELDLLHVVARLVIILMDPAEIEDAGHPLPREIVVVAPVVEAIRVIRRVEGVIQDQAWTHSAVRMLRSQHAARCSTIASDHVHVRR